jgi:hypothetical protein
MSLLGSSRSSTCRLAKRLALHPWAYLLVLERGATGSASSLRAIASHKLMPGTEQRPRHLTLSRDERVSVLLRLALRFAARLSEPCFLVHAWSPTPLQLLQVQHSCEPDEREQEANAILATSALACSWHCHWQSKASYLNRPLQSIGLQQRLYPRTQRS